MKAVALCFSLTLAPLLPLAAPQSQGQTVEADIRLIRTRPRLVLSASAEQTVIAPETKLLVFCGTEPITEATWVGEEDGQGTFEAVRAVERPLPPQDLHAWLVAPDLVAKLLPRWPADAALQANIDSVGPGSRSIWLLAGANQGVNTGDTWWLRVGGQPAARCEIRFAGPDISFGTLVQLAREWAVEPGAPLVMWPAPGERRVGAAHSAVSRIEERDNGVLVWVAAPQNVDCPPEPHLDFYHNHRYVGDGLVERRDDRFWYTRFAPAVTAPSSAPARAESQPASGPTARLSVGDEVVIRTQADIDQQRFVARVFELTAAGALINAGESEGIAVGQGLSVYRVNAIVGRATAREVRRSYAVVACSAAGDAPPPELRLGDELRLTDPPAPPLVVGVIERLVEPTLFTARLMTESPPLASPLAVRAAGRTVGVAILLTAKDGRAGGFVVPCSLTRSLATGMQLVQETSPTESAQAPAAEPAHP